MNAPKTRRLVKYTVAMDEGLIANCALASVYSGHNKGRYPFLTRDSLLGKKSQFLWIDLDKLIYYQLITGRTFCSKFQLIKLEGSAHQLQIAAPRLEMEV